MKWGRMVFDAATVRRRVARARVARCCALAAAGLLLAAALHGEEPEEPSPTPSPDPSPSPAASILLSVQRAVEELPADWEAPCRDADRQQVPCFPAHVEAPGTRYSVADSLNHVETTGPRPPGPPTVPEMQARSLFAPGRATVPLVRGDPVCAARSLVKLLGGRNDTYYVYRIVDSFGPRAAMYEKPIDPETYARAPGVSYELIGRFRGECEALRAYRSALRNVPVADQREAQQPVLASDPTQPQ
jgi:hypothetical protein